VSAREAAAPAVATKFGALYHRDYRRYFLLALGDRVRRYLGYGDGDLPARPRLRGGGVAVSRARR
jgi:hypothetical protein